MDPQTLDERSDDIEAPGQASPVRAARGANGSSRRGAVVLVLLFLVGFLGTARLGAQLEGPLPFPENHWHRKFGALMERAERGEVDTVVIGSSHVFRHVDPEVFDRTLRAAGRPSSTFNLGMPGMTPLELDFVVDRLRDLDPPGVERLFISPPRLAMEVEPSPLVTRSVNLHDAERFVRASELLMASDLGPWQKLHLTVTHGVVSLRNIMRVGVGYEALRDRIGGTAQTRERRGLERTEELSEVLGPRGDGYEALVVAGDNKLLMRRAAIWNKSGRREFVRGLRERRENGPPNVVVPRGLGALLQRVEARCRAAGWEVVFFTHPLITPDDPTEQYVHLWRPPGGSLVLDFSDPDRYPELFDPDRYFDLRHLNQPGSKRFTARLAEAYLEATEAED